MLKESRSKFSKTNIYYYLSRCVLFNFEDVRFDAEGVQFG